MSARILVADVGGTNTRFAVMERRQGRWEEAAPAASGAFRSRDFKSFLEPLDAFRDAAKGALDGVRHAAFAVAGPVLEGDEGRAIKPTNLEWEPLTERALEERLGMRVRLLNDVEAVGFGLNAVPEGEFEIVKPGAAAPRGLGLVVQLGTGFGAALLRVEGRRDGAAQPGTVAEVFPGEAGHPTLASDAPDARAVRDAFRAAHGLAPDAHVPAEALLSGPGLARLYRALAAATDEWPAPEVARAAPADVAIRVAEAARRGDAVARRACERFAAHLGAHLGNVVLATGAVADVYLSGSLARDLREWLVTPAFRAAFDGKGRLEPFVARSRVLLVEASGVTRRGAAEGAARAFSLSA